MEVQLISKAEVVEMVGMSYPTLWALMRKQQFPRPLELSGTAIRWRRDEIVEWINGLPRREYAPQTPTA